MRLVLLPASFQLRLLLTLFYVRDCVHDISGVDHLLYLYNGTSACLAIELICIAPLLCILNCYGVVFLVAAIFYSIRYWSVIFNGSLLTRQPIGDQLLINYSGGATIEGSSAHRISNRYCWINYMRENIEWIWRKEKTWKITTHKIDQLALIMFCHWRRNWKLKRKYS